MAFITDGVQFTPAQPPAQSPAQPQPNILVVVAGERATIKAAKFIASASKNCNLVVLYDKEACLNDFLASRFWLGKKVHVFSNVGSWNWMEDGAPYYYY